MNAGLITDRTMVEQRLRFLLANCPLIDAPQTMMSKPKSSIAFAYIHPKTFVIMVRDAHYEVERGEDYHVCKFADSPTKWILTSLMPEGGVIYSKNMLPGMKTGEENGV